MNKRMLLILPLAFLALGLALLVSRPTRASESLTIPVEGADAVFQPDLATGSGFNTTLRGYIDALSPMLVQVRSPDATFWTEMGPISDQPTLKALLDGLDPMLIQVRSPDATFWRQMTSVYKSPVLAALLANLPDYYIPLRSADAAFESVPFAYPVALIHDTTPPVISNVQVETITGLVTWDTDEFADSEAHFGPSYGNYPISVTDDTWVTAHLLLPSGGGGAYMKIRSTDRSGNTAEYYYPGFSVSGNVRDTQDNPIQGVIVSVTDSLFALTDEDGNYSIIGVPAGSYTLTAHHDLYHFTPESQAIVVAGDLINWDFIGEVNVIKTFLPLLRR